MRTRPETAAAGNYHSCPGGRHWGPRGAAGILPFAVARDGRVWVLLSHRSRWVQAGDTWSCFGGAIDQGENAWQAAERETHEEVDGIVFGRRDVTAEMVAPCAHQCGWSYTTFVVQVEPAEGYLPPVRVADGSHAWETNELAWVPVSQVPARDLHPGFEVAWPTLRKAIA